MNANKICIECKYAKERQSGVFVTCTLNGRIQDKTHSCGYFQSEAENDNCNNDYTAEIKALREQVEQMADDIRLLKRLIR